MRGTLDFIARASCWLMAPLYIGLLGAILLVSLEFGRELVSAVSNFPNSDASSAIVAVLRLISLILVGQLAFIMILAGLRTLLLIATEGEPARAVGEPHADSGNVRVRIISVMVAIGAVDLLEVLLGAQTPFKAEDIFWKIMILVTFVFVGGVLVVTERIVTGSRGNSA